LVLSEIYALDRYPNIPSDVITDKIITLIVKYTFITLFILFQDLYKNDAVTNLPNSSTAPIAAICSGAAENINVNPTIEKYPAIADINRADSKSSNAKIMLS
jgi:hypothetical protein